MAVYAAIRSYTVADRVIRRIVVDMTAVILLTPILDILAGTLLRAQGYLERRLADITSRTGTNYNVTWQDYDTGAPITAQMVAEKIDIGSMGDYPMLINGSKTQANERARTELEWRPRYDFARVIALLRAGEDPRSPLARAVGSKMYHEETFAEGPYPVGERN